MYNFIRKFIFLTGCWAWSLFVLLAFVEMIEVSFEYKIYCDPWYWIGARFFITGWLYYYFGSPMYKKKVARRGKMNSNI